MYPNGIQCPLKKEFDMTDHEKANVETAKKFFASWGQTAKLGAAAGGGVAGGDNCLQLLKEDVIYEAYGLPTPVMRGREEARKAVEGFQKAFPDMHVAIEQTLASGNTVVVRWKTTGTQKQAFAHIAPSNKQVTTHGCAVLEIDGGKIAHCACYFDTHSLLKQMGAIH
jgi:steroid delta-isomerase-like uncharacterized protein